MSIVTVAGPFVLISNCYANIILSEGKAGMAMIGQLLLWAQPVADVLSVVLVIVLYQMTLKKRKIK